MFFVERLLLLQKERKLTDKAVELGAGLSRSSMYQWRVGRGKPTLDNIVKVATYFGVTSDYLLGLSDLRTPALDITKEELLLLFAYRGADEEGRFHIIQVCMNEKEATQKREPANVG